MSLKVGDTFPKVQFKYIPYTPETQEVTACGIPENYDAYEVSPRSGDVDADE